MTSFEQIVAAVEALKEDATKFYEKGNSAAGTRYRKGLQALRAQLKVERDNVTAIKKEKKAEA
jgi:hypothetical protein